MTESFSLALLLLLLDETKVLAAPDDVLLSNHIGRVTSVIFII